MVVEVRGTVGKLPTGLHPQVYNFRVSGSNLRYPTFGCVALSPAEAHQMALDAGMTDVALTRIRDLGPRELDSFGQRVLTDTPFLGSAWMPLAQAIRELGVRLPYEKTLVLQALTAANGYDDDGSPFVQFLRRADGSLQAEIGSGRSLRHRPMTLAERDVLVGLEWSEPNVLGPLMTKTYLPGFSWYLVAFDALIALTLAFAVTEHDHVAFLNQPDFAVREGKLLTPVGDGVYALPGYGLPRSAVRYDDDANCDS